MAKKHGKKYLEVSKLVDPAKQYSLDEAVSLLKKTAYTKFDSTIEVHMRMGIDPKQADQLVRGVVSLPNGTGNFGSYCADIRLAVSRDGEHFKRIQPHQKVIGRGRRGEWDDGFLVISDKPVIKDNTIYLYYAGNGEDWTSWPGGNIPPGYRFPSTGSVRLSRMGLATLEADRFTCLETTDRETPGIVTTVPITMASRQPKPST